MQLSVRLGLGLGLEVKCNVDIFEELSAIITTYAKNTAIINTYANIHEELTAIINTYAKITPKFMSPPTPRSPRAAACGATRNYV